ncbi:NAD(P)H-hydrate epimerase [Gemmatirosa kalamazoonensis]|uniref:Bifunctional NAD(P)H-hydrate repair enzyme n=1 Tax=Gemmatirosa kalamazoonensis TaxID=861299 RepID=W0RJM8_9BACT|nr:NAD(P)H-hydrate dehydratase [Gemmatirosa kalamazoonensis]AHG90545.1 NAD(P)H-hydrate epimerase [Gemmatirosa kalamazoonensis]
MTSRIPVVTAAESAARDRAAIDAGTPSRALMQRAGAAAAAEIARRYGDRLRGGVAVHAGPGNNGGDGWVVAAALRRWGATVRAALHGADEPKTDDARYERARALADGTLDAPTGSEAVVVDGVLGTGARGAPAPFAAAAVERMHVARASGAVVVALDVPTGLDATTGENFDPHTVRADLTLTFGTLKRGLLVARGHAGTIAVVDIGLGEAPNDVGPVLSGAADVARLAPALDAAAHKGTRGKIAIVGGAAGMAGATLLSAEAALRSGAGMARVVVAPESVPVAQTALREALASPWPTDDAALAHTVTEWADVVVLGPGLGRDDAARALAERVLAAWRGPVVLDADAVTMFAGDTARLGTLLRGRPALLTPHPLELSRLAGLSLDEILARRFDVGRELAATLGASVLLKGVPTVISDEHATLVSATGTPALATAGSGDVLTGIAAALLVHANADARATERGAAAAWIHGRAGEIATARRGGVRGTTLRDVLGALSDAWRGDAARAPYPVLAELPAVPG